ncbi:MAG: DUF1178 family protein [Maricaulaceae bacterium]
MIKYALICSHEHVFDVWFSKSSDYEDQLKAGYLSCPHCADTNIEKAIMAPNVSTSRKKTEIASKQAASLAMVNAAAEKIRKEIETNCDYVGDKFADEARAIHYGEKEERGIYGQATKEEAAALSAEGVTVAPLPDVIAPKPKSKLN